MVRAVLVFVLTHAAAGAPTCQQAEQADESTLLQGVVTRRTRHSLQTHGIGHSLQLHHSSLGSDAPDFTNASAVVEWIDAQPDKAADWVADNTEAAADWLNNNPEAAVTIFDTHPDIEYIMEVAQQNQEHIINCQSHPDALCLKLLPHKTRCLRGKAAGYYSRINEASDVWVIFMDGGGGCSNAAECANWNQGWGPDNWNSWSGGRGAVKPRCNQNPHFCDANHVFIPYCSGDLHQGQRDAEHETFYMSGHLNFKAIIEDLIATTLIGSSNRVLLTGTSAGGIGVVTNADTLTTMLPNATVKAAPIASWFMPDRTSDHPEESWMSVSSYEDHSAGKATDTSEALNHWQVQQDWGNPYRGNCPLSEGLKCQNVPTRAAYVTTPMFVSENMWDTHHMGTNGVDYEHPEEWSDEVVSWLAYYAESMQASTTHWVGLKAGNGLFLPATFNHGGGIGANKRDMNVLIDDHEYFDTMAQWFFDDTLSSHVFTDDMDTSECLAHLEGLRSGA